MSTLHIANCAKQTWDFSFRLAQQRVRLYPIPAGQQIAIPDLKADEIDLILKQHTAYGMLPQDRIGRETKLTGLVYAIDKPVKLDGMLEMMESNDQALVDRSTEKRAVALNAAQGALDETAQLAQNGVNGMEVSIQEVRRPGDNEERESFSQTVSTRPQQPGKRKGRR